MERLIERQIEGGTECLVLCGTTGEGSALSKEETLEVFSRAVDVVKKRIYLVGGVGSNVTHESAWMALEAKRIGLDGGLVITPYYSRPEPQGVIRHFEEVAKAGLPLIAYNHPGRTGCRLSLGTLKKICSIDGVVGVKDCSGDLSLLQELVDEVDTPIYTGDDTLAFAQMAVGAKGSISIVANVFPHGWKLALKDRERYRAIRPFCQAMVSETNPQPVKHALHLMGLCENVFRLPLLPPKKEVSETLARLLDELGHEARPAGLV